MKVKMQCIIYKLINPRCNYTGCGKITSINFKVYNKRTIRDTKILFLDSETTTWEVLNHIV